MHDISATIVVLAYIWSFLIFLVIFKYFLSIKIYCFYKFRKSSRFVEPVTKNRPTAFDHWIYRNDFVVASFQDPNWYKAKNSAGREGTIPANYVQKREGVKSGGKLSLMP